MDSKFKINRPFFDMDTESYFFVQHMSRYHVSKKLTPLPIMLGSVVFSLIMLSGCSEQQSAYEQSTTEEVADYASEDMDNAVETEQSAVASLESGATTSPIKLKVENQAGDSEQTLGSQVANIQIKGKELLITANANFKVEDVVKSTNAIESLTRQQGGYVALSNI